VDAVQVRLVERLHLDFVRAGAKFDAAAQKRYAAIMGRLAELTTTFSQNVLGDETAFTLLLSHSDLSGCPPDLVAAARQAAAERDMAADDHVITLSRSLVEPFLTFSDRRDLRERAWRAWTKRGELDPQRDNHPIMREVGCAVCVCMFVCLCVCACVCVGGVNLGPVSLWYFTSNNTNGWWSHAVV
jgi:peptidyl-dipeptidase Dcp